MRTTSAAYLLILLSLFGQVHDALLAQEPLTPAQAYADADNDDLLLTRPTDVQQRGRRHEPAPLERWAVSAGTLSPPRAGNVFAATSYVGSGARPFQYAFMSLLC